jgi:hypothetical protein
MPRRSILSPTERATLLALPENQDDLIRYYTFNDSDLSLIADGGAMPTASASPCSFACCATRAMRWATTLRCPSP